MDRQYGIFRYNVNTFCSYISYQTKTTLSRIKNKPQVVYIDNYLRNFDLNTIFFIYEDEYIDQHYLEDYASYHVRCFKDYRKTCSRIHLFSTENLEKIDLNKTLVDFFNNKRSCINKENYLGFIVIRPIPETFISKICFKPYKNLIEEENKFILNKTYNVSLFGKHLSIKSIAFQEQDKIISACATTSLWTFFHAHQMMNIKNLPSPNVITKSAYSYNEKWNSREFPNYGLSIDMISKSLKEFGLAPERFEFEIKNKDKEKDKDKEERFNLFKEYIYSYCSSEIPLILGVSIFDKIDDIEKGLHAVTIIGYSIDDSTIKTKSNKYSHRINKIYVHDDRYGPYLKIDLSKNKFEVVLNNNSDVSYIENYKIEIYNPDVLILGLYHKIRIPYIKIVEKCEAYIKTLIAFMSFENDEDIKPLIKFFENIEWDIKIKDSAILKSEIKKNKLLDREKYLTKSLPKYVWSAVARNNKKTYFELIFDATDIEFGNIFIEFITIHKGISSIFKDLSNTYAKVIRPYNQEQYLIKEIFDYFSEIQNQSNNLSELYGYLNIPKNIRPSELIYDEVMNQCEKVLYKEDVTYELINKPDDYMYIWVIDIEGNLRIGKEYVDNKKGHPTLTNAMPARIGGQLIYKQSEDKWIVDPFSGRYSSGYENDEKIKYLENAIKYKFNLFMPNYKFEAKVV